MKIRQDDSSSELTESTLPMINVVFLLLIFFMIAGSLQKTLPFDITPLQAQADATQQQAPLIVHVAADGRIMIEEQEVTLKLFETKIQEHLRADQTEENSNLLSKHSITIRSDQSTNTTIVVKILSILKKLKIKQVALATVR